MNQEKELVIVIGFAHQQVRVFIKGVEGGKTTYVTCSNLLKTDLVGVSMVTVTDYDEYNDDDREMFRRFLNLWRWHLGTDSLLDTRGLHYRRACNESKRKDK